VNRPRGARTYTILEIDYRDPPGKSSRRR
jgi:hypothetical protein